MRSLGEVTALPREVLPKLEKLDIHSCEELLTRLSDKDEQVALGTYLGVTTSVLEKAKVQCSKLLGSAADIKPRRVGFGALRRG